MNKLATIISVVFHPIFIPLYGIISLLSLKYFFFLPFFSKTYIVLLVAMFTCIIPGLFLFLLYKANYINSISVEKKEQRYILYIVSIISYLLCIYLFWKIRMPYWVILMSLCISTIMLAMFIINFFWKISIHAAAIGSFTGGLFFVAYLLHINPVTFFLATLLVGASVMAARLQLKVHTTAQVICGYLLGFFFMIFFPFIL